MGEITLESLAAKLGQLEGDLEAQKLENGLLKGQLATIAGEALKNEPAKKLTVPVDELSYKGKKYMWRAAGYQKDGNIIPAAEIEADEKLIAEILKIEGQGILVEKK